MPEAPSPTPPPPSERPPSAETALETLRSTPISQLTRMPPVMTRALGALREDFELADLEYRAALTQVETRLETLQDEFTLLHDYNPIEHIATRVKSPESILRKAADRGLPLDLDALRDAITDIAGARVILSFTEDVYRVFHHFTSQPDIRVREVEDYIASPKASGYRSLHCLVAVPVHFSTGTRHVTVEMQFRTIAMDFWASLEHKINYQFHGDAPEGMVAELAAAARVAADLDTRMEHLHREVQRRIHVEGGEAADDDGGADR